VQFGRRRPYRSRLSVRSAGGCAALFRVWNRVEFGHWQHRPGPCPMRVRPAPGRGLRERRKRRSWPAAASRPVVPAGAREEASACPSFGGNPRKSRGPLDCSQGFPREQPGGPMASGEDDWPAHSAGSPPKSDTIPHGKKGRSRRPSPAGRAGRRPGPQGTSTGATTDPRRGRSSPTLSDSIKRGAAGHKPRQMSGALAHFR
jgi:hypothetical protein